MAMTREQIEAFQKEKRRIEENSLKSTEESLRLLKETETCGITTTEELNRQGQQLTKIDRQLDDINGLLTKSKRHINGMKSMFGGLKNLFGKKDTNEADINSNESNSKISCPKTSLRGKKYDNNGSQLSNYSSPSAKSEQQQLLPAGSDFDTRLNANMDEMSKSISMLKSLATDMCQEIEYQNELIDGIQIKTEQADITIQQQNKQMRKILGK